MMQINDTFMRNLQAVAKVSPHFVARGGTASACVDGSPTNPHVTIEALFDEEFPHDVRLRNLSHFIRLINLTEGDRVEFHEDMVEIFSSEKQRHSTMRYVVENALKSTTIPDLNGGKFVEVGKAVVNADDYGVLSDGMFNDCLVSLKDGGVSFVVSTEIVDSGFYDSLDISLEGSSEKDLSFVFRNPFRSTVPPSGVYKLRFLQNTEKLSKKNHLLLEIQDMEDENTKGSLRYVMVSTREFIDG